MQLKQQRVTRLMVDVALEHARAGWRVFPVRPRSKVPTLKAWPTLATSNEAQIREWWRRWPTANIGGATGEDSDITVIDIDNDAGHAAWLAFLNGRTITTRRVITGEGEHQYFRCTDPAVRNETATLRPGLACGRPRDGRLRPAAGLDPSDRA